MSNLVKNTKQFYSTLAIALIIFVFVLTAIIVTSEPLPLGSDAYFHLQMGIDYWQGNFTGVSNLMFGVNHYFYPPFYHIIVLAPVALSPDPYTGLRILEMIFLPLTFLLVAFVTWKTSGPKATLISGMILLGGWAYLDGAIQARPESIDLLLYPLILYALLTSRKKWVGALAAITIYNHGFAALSSILGFAVKKLQEKTWRKTITYTLLITAPIIILGIYYFTGAWQMWATASPVENPQESLFWTNPAWIFFYGGLSLLGWIFVIKPTYQYIRYRKTPTQLETLLCCGLFGNLLMLPFWADRWLQYNTIPLAMLIGLNVSQWHGKKLYITIAAIAIGTWIYVCFFLLTSFYHNWWQPARFVPLG
jgi:hypothetical protein